MNELEREMVQQLQDLRENHHVMGVKAEFEAEGTRLEEASASRRSSAGGTRADDEGRRLRGSSGHVRVARDRRGPVVGPMVESPWALHKFLEA